MEELNKFFIKNNFTQEEYSSLLASLKDGFPVWRQEFQSVVDSAIGKIRRCNPRTLLCACAYRIVGYKISKHSESDECKWRAIEFIQNILVTHKSQPDNLDDNAMLDFCVQVVLEVENLYVEYLKVALFVSQMIPERITDKEERDFISQATLMYIVRGKRDISFQRRYFSFLLDKQDANLRNEFGLSAQEIIAGIDKLCQSLYYCKAETFRENVKYTQKQLRAITKKGNGFEQVLIDGYERANQDALDVSPYDVEAITGWSRSFISKFSMPLAEKDVVEIHDYQFWPCDDFVTKTYPFIELDNRYYCFDYYAFVDNIYHGLFKACIANDVKFGHKWSDAQTDAVENGVAEIFESLLPGVKVYRNLKYTSTGNKEGELDVVAVSSGMLIVIETKGMEYFQDSPILHPEKLLNFYKRSVKKAGEQTRRFMEYVDNSNEIVLKDNFGKIVIKCTRADLGRICRMCVLSDSTNEFIACTNKLETIKIDAKGLICISLDDLLVYEKYFENSPMLFLAYLSRRLDASYEHKVCASDELDHLGLYIGNADYVHELQKYDSQVDFMSIDDNRRELDKFFLSLRYPDIAKPSPYLPDVIKLLLAQVWKSSTKNKLEIATFIMDLSKGEKDWLARSLEEELVNQKATGVANLRGTSLDKSPSGIGISLVVNTMWALPMPRDVWFARVQGLMTKFYEHQRIIFSLNYDPTGGLLDCSIEAITPNQFEERLFNDARSFVEEVDRRVVAKALKRGRIGRNDPCPCGSGKKYKKCCAER